MNPIPPEALEDAGIVLGRRGAGKSNALMTLFEQELDAGHRAVMIDPKGDRFGIRMNPDGSPSRFDIPIFGGDHGDLDLDETMGEALGRLVAEHDLSCLIDLSVLSLGAKQRFMLDFAPELLRRNRAALTLFIEEVDQFANQDPRYQPAMLVHHIANFATLGRQRGIVPWVASQRPAKVNATVRSQADTFIGMKVTSPLDRDAYRDWFKGHGKEAAARVEEEVGRLKPGEALVWIGATEFFDKVQFPLASTFDSGRTPKHGETIETVKLAPIDLGAIRTALDLGRENPESTCKDSSQAIGSLADQDTADLIDELDRRDPEWFKQYPEFQAAVADRDHFKAGFEQYQSRIKSALRALGVVTMDELDQEDWERGLQPARAPAPPQPDLLLPAGPASPASPAPKPARQPAAPREGPLELNATARKMLEMLDRIAPARVPWGSLAAMIGNKARGGNFNAARKAMRDSGLIVEDGETVRSVKPPAEGMSREEAFELWSGVLTNPAPRMMQALHETDGATKKQIGEMLGIVPRGGNFNNGIAQLVRNGVVVNRGGVLHLSQPLPGESR